MKLQYICAQSFYFKTRESPNVKHGGSSATTRDPPHSGRKPGDSGPAAGSAVPETRGGGAEERRPRPPRTPPPGAAGASQQGRPRPFGLPVSCGPGSRFLRPWVPLPRVSFSISSSNSHVDASGRRPHRGPGSRGRGGTRVRQPQSRGSPA